MRTRTNDFKTNIVKFGRELDVLVSYNLDEETVTLTNEEVFSVSLHYEGSLLKSIMRQLDIISSIDIPIGTTIDIVQFGVKVRNSNQVQDYRDNYDYIDLGNYYVYSSEKQEDTNNYKIVCYDKMLFSMKDYIPISQTFPMTLDDYINNICNQIGITFANYGTTYPNHDRIINSDIYAGINYKYRDVLDDIAQAVAGIICINDNENIEIRYPENIVDTFNEEYLKDANVNFSQKYGPINSIVLSRAAESDNVYLRDENSIAANGLCELKIIDNQLMNNNDRADYLPDILNKLDGLEYYIDDFESTGITYLDICDLYSITVGEKTYPCLMLNDDFTIGPGLKENIYSNAPSENVTDYSKADKTDRKLNETWLMVDKQNGTIEGLSKKVSSVEDDLGNVYTKEEVNSFINSAEQGWTNTFSEAGGANMLRNTTFTSNDVLETGQKYEYWFGNVIRTTNTSSKNGYSILLQNTTLYQEQNIANGPYTLSFMYRVTNPLATVKVKINDKEYTLTNDSYTLFQTGISGIDPINITSNTIKVSFICDLANACEIYDIMLNSGSIKLAYSQNPNEVVTNTVNIQKGITITSSSSEIKFTANNDGIRTKTLNDEIITEFTDKGTKTKEIEVEDQAIIVGILRQKVGNQVWDSLI